MRFVKFTLVGLIGVTLTFMSLGFFHTSFQYENTIEVAASVEQSYKTFTNDSLNAEWLPGFIGVEVLSGAPLVPGSRFLITFEQDGERMSMVEVLREVKENEKFIVDMETEIFTGKVGVANAAGVSTTSAILLTCLKLSIELFVIRVCSPTLTSLSYLLPTGRMIKSYMLLINTPSHTQRILPC